MIISFPGAMVTLDISDCLCSKNVIKSLLMWEKMAFTAIITATTTKTSPPNAFGSPSGTNGYIYQRNIYFNTIVLLL